MHWYREGARQRSRILYVFRSPGGVRVGRASLDAGVRREIESQHPQIEFDWKSVLANQQVIESAVETRRPRKKPRAEERAPDTGVSATAAAAPPQQKPSVPSALEGATPDAQIAFLNQ